MKQRQDFEQLFAEHARDVLAYAMRRASPAEAEDVVAEVFAIAWRRRSEIPTGQPLLWLYGVSRRVLANQRRSSRRRARLLGSLQEAYVSAVSQGGDGRVMRALAALSEADRELLMLVAWEGLSGTEAAAVLGCTAGTLHTRLHRARRRLARHLEDLPEQDPSPWEARCAPEATCP